MYSVIIPLGVLGSVQDTWREVEERAVTEGGGASDGAVEGEGEEGEGERVRSEGGFVDEKKGREEERNRLT